MKEKQKFRERAKAAAKEQLKQTARDMGADAMNPEKLSQKLPEKLAATEDRTPRRSTKGPFKQTPSPLSLSPPTPPSLTRQVSEYGTEDVDELKQIIRDYQTQDKYQKDLIDYYKREAGLEDDDDDSEEEEGRESGRREVLRRAGRMHRHGPVQPPRLQPLRDAIPGLEYPAGHCI